MISRRVLILLAVACCCSASALKPSDQSADALLTRLSHVETFAFGGTGFAMSISQGEKDYRALLARPSAAANFKRLFAHGNPQAKAYALVGLQQTDPNRFAKLAAALQSSTLQVQTMQGCIMFPYPMSTVISRIRSGMYSGPETR